MAGAPEKIRKLIIVALKDLSSLVFDLATLPLIIRYKGSRGRTLGSLVNYLATRGEIEKVGKSKYRLTDFGIVKSLPYIRKRLTSDGRVRVLVFDIPERERKKRDRLRCHLRLLGFKPVQKSVWISYEDCEHWIETLVNYHKVGNYVSLYVGKHIW